MPKFALQHALWLIHVRQMQTVYGKMLVWNTSCNWQYLNTHCDRYGDNRHANMVSHICNRSCTCNCRVDICLCAFMHDDSTQRNVPQPSVGVSELLSRNLLHYCLAQPITVITVAIKGQLAARVSDVDECALSVHNCDTNAICTNTNGSFTCACVRGYSGNGTTAGCQGIHIS